MVATPQNREPDAPTRGADQRVHLHGLSWADYDALLAMRGERSVPRIAYVEGELELMSPSHDHEQITWVIGHVLLLYARARGIVLVPAGAWTVREQASERGLEPDACFTIGPIGDRTRPDLAIEVIWTHGGLDKLDIYRALGVREVWFWEDGGIRAFVLRDGAYVAITNSDALPGLDIALVSRLSTLLPHEAAAELEAALRG